MIKTPFKIIAFIFFIFLLFITITNNAYSQLNDEDVVLEISPENPTANTEAIARLKTFSFDLNKTSITWLLNNEIKARGIGQTSFVFNVGDIGTEILISATIDTIDGKSFFKQTLVKSNDIDLLWEAPNSYAPLFYKGKTLVAKEGEIKVVAIPSTNLQTKSSGSRNFTFNWIKDGKNQKSFSGWAKDYFIFKNTYLEDGGVVSVNISDITGKINSSKSISLRTFDPKIIFYKKDKLGNWDLSKSLGHTPEINKEGDTIVAIPYFFSPLNMFNKDIVIDWFVADKPIRVRGLKNELVVIPEKGENGTTNIKTLIGNSSTLFQEQEKSALISF